MKYQGGKSRIVKHLAPFLLEGLSGHGGRLVEPFVGGFNIVPEVSDSITEALCLDIHPGLISLYLALSKGWVPPCDVTENEYCRLRQERDWSNPMTAFVAFGCSFGGKEWGGYARSRKTTRNYAREGCTRLLSKVPSIQKCAFENVSYDQLDEPLDALIYADPPYRDTLSYTKTPFDHEKFYLWCEHHARCGSTVLVSEFFVPPRRGWDVIWERERAVTMALADSNERKTERLILVSA